MKNKNEVGAQVFSAIILAAMVIFWGPAIFSFYAGLICCAFILNWPIALGVLGVSIWLVRREVLRHRASSK